MGNSDNPAHCFAQYWIILFSKQFMRYGTPLRAFLGSGKRCSMPRSPDGSYSLPAGTLVSSGDTILVSQHNPAMQDIASALGKSLDRDGTGGMRSPLDMGGFPIINAAPGSDPTDLATVEQAASNGVPIGSVVDFAGTTAPPGYLQVGRASCRERVGKYV